MSEQAFSLGADYQFALRISEQGTVISVGDGIIWVRGLPSVMMDEELRVQDGSRALVFLLDRDRVGAILLQQGPELASGMQVMRSGKRLDIGTGDSLLGRVIDPLGNALDGEPDPVCESRGLLEVPSVAILARDFVARPLYTGNRIIDSQIPIGKGQRQLIIGDGGLGKSALAIDTVLRQRGENVLCIYVCIGQTRSSVSTVMDTLRRHHAMEYTCMVVAEANELSGCRYLAPFAGCAIAEAWMQQGRDTLIIYDDLTQHAQAYRELSLLLHRPVGREAYPGDIFYLHSRLLERSTVYAQHLGGGSMTALPLVETKQGEISAYIPTNLISITDGQIYLDQKLFAAGILPAIDVTKSVSRIGGKAQHPAIKKEAGRIRLDYLQFLELEAFTRFGTKLEAAMEEKLQRGRILRKILAQDRLSPVSARGQLAWLIAYNEKLLDNTPPEQVSACLLTLQQAVDNSSLQLDDGREHWLEQLRMWMAAH
ncbi:MAG: F0F1 ATP synthase subunit alpha [Oceanospirillaceae bacterium]|nr:F0F1 ATP synthase subunit alpha [Oceanospirillaceae bacterium]MCP5335180.1 F0F1 ATP synthase subunit alpha [Oceanospirillaceae bacterium]MCP5351517.1 F0F1 ATP synthase subunit alpha [Oceanospirillaceae bacterium]